MPVDLAVAGSIRAAKSLPLDIRYLQVEWYLNLELGDSTLRTRPSVGFPRCVPKLYPVSGVLGYHEPRLRWIYDSQAGPVRMSSPSAEP